MQSLAWPANQEPWAGSLRAAAVPSPCVRNCCLDAGDVCLGCLRSLDEICAWGILDDDGKRAVLERCRFRARGPGWP